MKQTLEDYIRHDKVFRQVLLKLDGGILKFWAEHPDRGFDVDLFDDYEKQIVEDYLLANKRNRDVASLPENELKMEARSWNHHTEKEIHYKVALQPLMADLPVAVREQANHYIDDYLADAYRDYRRCYYPKGITPQAFYDEVVKQFGSGGLACDCMDYILREHHHPEVWAKKKGEYALMTEFFIQQYSEVIGKDAFKMLRQAVKEKLAGKNHEECRREAIKTMNLVKGFSRMIYSSAEVGISDCTGRYIVDKEYLRELTGTDAALRLLSNAKVSPLHECFFNYVTLLNDIGRIWAARLLKYYGIDMHKLEKETGAILYPVTKPLQNPDGAVHGNYKYYVDKDFSDSLDDQCCIYDEKQAKDLLDALRKEKKSENLASQLKDSITQFVDNINKKPEMVMDLGKLAAKTKFDWSFMNAVICGLSEKWLMDKAIQVMVDTWNEHVSRNDDICYKTEGYTTIYEADEHGLYSRQVPMMKILKYTFLEQNLKAIRDGELERREVDAKFNKMKVDPKLLVLRAVDAQDDTKYEDLEEYEVNTILEKLEGEGFIKVAWIEGHRPEAIRMLDKGRAYLKHLEEGIIDVMPLDSTQNPSDETQIENPGQIPQTVLASGHTQVIPDEEWDDTFDYIFDERVKPKAIKIAMDGIVIPNKISLVRFFYVVCRILEILQYLTKKATRPDFLRWVNLHFNCGWIDDNEHRKQFVFALEGSSKNLEEQHPSEWNEKTIKGGSGKYHHQLAVTLKNTFTETMVGENAVDNSDSFEHLRDRGQFLRYAYHIKDNEYYIPEEAFINNGK